MAQIKESPGPGWDPFIGQRVFKSARSAWMVYGQYRFSIAERTFYNYVGVGKTCAPRPDGQLCVEDIELFAQSQAWPVTPSFVRGAQKGGEGEADVEALELGVEFQKEKYRKMKMEADLVEIDLKKKLRELLPRSDYEKRLAAAAAVVSNGLETLVYDNVREMIHLCDGKPEKEDSLREYLLDKIRQALHAFSHATLYAVTLEDGPQGADWEDEACAYEAIEGALASEEQGEENGGSDDSVDVD